MDGQAVLEIVNNTKDSVFSLEAIKSLPISSLDGNHEFKEAIIK